MGNVVTVVTVPLISLVGLDDLAFTEVFDKIVRANRGIAKRTVVEFHR